MSYHDLRKRIAALEEGLMELRELIDELLNSDESDEEVKLG